MTWLIRVLVALNAVAVFALGASRQSWPAGFWTEKTAGWVVASLALTAIVPVVQVFIVERGERARRRALERQHKVEAFLTTSLIYIVRHGAADWENTGIQAFLVRGRWRQQQVRLAKVRLGAIPTSGIVWGAGKGVIGRCWARRAPQFEDLEAHFAQFNNHDLAAWDALSADQRFGLTWSDFQTLKGKYGVVAAVPIIGRNDRYIGCVTADTPPHHDGQALPKDVVLGSLATTAKLVGELLND